MKTTRRILAIILSIVAAITLVVALVVRVAYNAALDTDTYVSTVTKIAENPDSLSRVSNFIENTLEDAMHLNDPQFYKPIQRAGIDTSTFEKQARQIVYDSVSSFLESDQFITLWAATNRKAHTGLLALVKSDAPVTKDFMLNFGPLMTAAATSIQDPENKISKFIPLKNLIPDNGDFQFKLIQASGVEDLRNAVDIAGKARTGLLFSSLFLLALAWLIFGRTRGAHRLVAISFMSAGILAFVVRATGKVVVGNVAGDEAKDSAKAIYTITTSPLTGYAVFVLLIGAAGFAATFYKRNNN